MKWAVLKAVPHLFPARSLNDMTEEEILWVRVQVAIDEGYGACRTCNTLGMGPYCIECGHLLTDRKDDTVIGECRNCITLGRSVIVSGRFCNACGEPTEDTLFWTQLQAGAYSYEQLNEQTRGKVTEWEKHDLEQWFGEAVWDDEEEEVEDG
jgi:hypothetical protein